MKNSYEIRGEVTAIIIDSPKYGKHEALISTSKLERAKEFPNTWVIAFRNNTFYVQSKMKMNKSKRSTKTAHLHRWIMSAPDGLHVDHIDHNGLNNTDINLRVITCAENQQNRNRANSTSKSGVLGVTWSEACKKWQASIKINQVKSTIGFYEDINSAKNAVTEARKKLMPYSLEAM